TIEDILCMLDEVEPGKGRRGYELLITTLRQGPQAELYRQIEQMAIDAGTDRSKVGWEREAVTHHRTLNRLLTLDAENLRLALAAGADLVATDLAAMVKICASRRARGQGDAVQLAALETELVASFQDSIIPGISEAQQTLDLAVEELVSAYAERVGPRLA